MGLFLPETINIATYAGTTSASIGTGSVGTGTVSGTIQSIFSMWHPSSNTKRIEIYRACVTTGGAAASSYFTVNGTFITAENASPGGSLETPLQFDQADPGSSLTGTTGAVRSGATGAPTRTSPDLLCQIFGGSTQGQQFIMFDATKTGKPLVLRAGVAEGFEFRTVLTGSSLTSQQNVSMTVWWTEV